MRGFNVKDLPERYQQQIRAQLAARPTRSINPIPQQNESTALGGEGPDTQGMVHSDRSLLVRITRISARNLDDDNLSGGCKELRDAIAGAFGRKGDSTKEGFTWEYGQNRD